MLHIGEENTDLALGRGQGSAAMDQIRGEQDAKVATNGCGGGIAGFLDEGGDGVAALASNAKPVVDTVELQRVVLGSFIEGGVGADFLDALAVPRAPTVGNHHPVIGAILGSHALHADFNHNSKISFPVPNECLPLEKRTGSLGPDFFQGNHHFTDFLSRFP